MAERTHGPWEIREAHVPTNSKNDDSFRAAVFHVYRAGDLLHYVAEIGQYSPNAEGNTRLIAAASDLLDAQGHGAIVAVRRVLASETWKASRTSHIAASAGTPGLQSPRPRATMANRTEGPWVAAPLIDGEAVGSCSVYSWSAASWRGTRT